jgi:hypothetical protein
MIPWVEGIVLKAGEVYQLPDRKPIAEKIFVSGVKFVGGRVWPAINKGPAFIVSAGVKDVQFYDVEMHFPDAKKDGQKIDGMSPCFVLRGEGTQIHRVFGGSINTFVQLDPSSDRTLISKVSTGEDMRNGLIYSNGGGTCTLEDSIALDSKVENLVRASSNTPKPGGPTFVPKALYVRRCNLSNPGNKAVIDIRAMNGGSVEDCTLTASQGHACAGIGDKQLTASEQGVIDFVFRNNKCFNGLLQIHEGCKQVYFLYNDQFNLRSTDVGISLNPVRGHTKNIVLVGNRGNRQAPSKKPFITPEHLDKVEGLLMHGNGWNDGGSES